MSGAFGGFLAVVNAVGGGVLTILIGTRAWASSSFARRWRLLFGAYCIGAGIGGALIVGGFIHSYDWEELVFLAYPLVAVLVTFALELVRRFIEES